MSKCVCVFANLVIFGIRPNAVGREKWLAGVLKIQFQPWASRITKMRLIRENTIKSYIAESVVLLRADFSYV